MRDRTAIVEWGTLGRNERDALRLGARQLGAAVELHYLSAPIEVLFNRVRSRGMEALSSHPDLMRCAKTFEASIPEEMSLFDTSSYPGYPGRFWETSRRLAGLIP
jgi:hypothetical protein